MVGEHGEKGHPWTNLIPVLLGHHPGDLGEVPQVVHHPSRQELAQRDTTQARVFPREIELSRGQRPKRLDQCPRAYDPSGATVSVNDRHQIVVGGRPLLRARGPVWHLAWGVDGSLAVLVEGGRLDRYEGGRLVGTASMTPPTPEHPLTIWPPELAPDNCAALSVGGDVVRLIDLGCFQGRAPRTFEGVYADWSPNGKWIAVAEPDGIVLHRVVGREASVRWDVVAGQLAWLSG